MPQRHHRIDLGRPAGGDIARPQRHGDEKQRNGDEGHRVGWFHAIEQASKKARQRQRDDDSDRNANGG